MTDDQRFEIITPGGQRYEGVNPEAWARQMIAQPDQVTGEVRAVLTCLLATIDGLRARVWEQDAVEGRYLAEQSLTNQSHWDPTDSAGGLPLLDLLNTVITELQELELEETVQRGGEMPTIDRIRRRLGEYLAMRRDLP